MECPRCGLLSPESAELCDCGYSFATRRRERATPDAAQSTANQRAWFAQAAAALSVGAVCALVVLVPEFRGFADNHAGLRGLGLLTSTFAVMAGAGVVFLVGLVMMSARAMRRPGSLISVAGVGGGLVALACWLLIINR